MKFTDLRNGEVYRTHTREGNFILERYGKYHLRGICIPKAKDKVTYIAAWPVDQFRDVTYHMANPEEVKWLRACMREGQAVERPKKGKEAMYEIY